MELPSYTVKVGSWIFNVISINDIYIYEEYIKRTEYPVNLWSSNFAYLYAISQSNMRKVLWKIVDDMLVTFVHTYKKSLYIQCLPFGKGNPEKVVNVLYKCMKYCYNINGKDAVKSQLKIINSSQLEFLRRCPEFDKKFRIVTWQGIERHYDVQKLVALKGSEFGNVRNRINKFRRENPDAIVCRYQDGDYEQLMKLGEVWKSTSGQKYSNIIDNTYYKELIKHHKELRQIVLVIKSGDEIIGMVSGSELPNNQAWGSLLKFKDGIAGLSETLIVEFAKEINRINPDIKHLNVGSDLGEKGLREYKMKFQPVLNLKRYQVLLKENEG